MLKLNLKWDNFHFLEDLNIFWKKRDFEIQNFFMTYLSKKSWDNWLIRDQSCTVILMPDLKLKILIGYTIKEKKQPMSWNWACKWTHLYLRWSILKSRYLRNTTCTRAALILIKKKNRFFFAKNRQRNKVGKMCLEIYQKETKLCQITYAIEL